MQPPTKGVNTRGDRHHYDRHFDRRYDRSKDRRYANHVHQK